MAARISPSLRGDATQVASLLQHHALIRSETCSCSSAVSSDHIKHTHHPLVFMLQDVAVVHALPLHVLPNLESHRLRLSDVHGVLPGKIRGLRLGPVPLALGDLKLCAVQMEWVIHVRWVTTSHSSTGPALVVRSTRPISNALPLIRNCIAIPPSLPSPM